MKKKIFAGLTRAEFMRQHWQKNPLVALNALPEYAKAIGRAELIALAQREDVESRIVRKAGREWHLKNGPFTRRDFSRLPRSGWTLLVQGVEQTLWKGARLLREFAFIPYARLDDLMVSYAAPGGGVGPHFDSYDVFLLQGKGERRWKFSRQRDLELVPDAPVKILKNFEPEQESVLGRGDLLYLPPSWAHDGVALTECITYSIGFRAPSEQELGSRFLEFLQDKLELNGMYADPDLRATQTPGRIPPAMLARFGSMLRGVRWSNGDIAEFTGRYLTEPKANVVFMRPRRALKSEDFLKQIVRDGLTLGLRTRVLAYGAYIFINGEAHRCDVRAHRLLAKLADQRQLTPPFNADTEVQHLLYEWYRAGYIEIGVRDG
ncbi:MAG TPA: cupin domain-containing protein [Burkholderiales bacterium]